MLNPHLNAIQVTNAECELFDQMVIEAIQVIGVDLVYIQLLESNHNALNDADVKGLKQQFTIEAQIMEIQSFGGESDIFGQFGFTPADSAVFKMAITRFKAEADKLGIAEPQEGDVLYDPVGNRLWEIRRVRTDDLYYVGNKRYCWILNCVIYQPKHEDNIDDFSGVVFQGTLGDLVQPSQDESDNFVMESEKHVTDVPDFDVNNPFGE